MFVCDEAQHQEVVSESTRLQDTNTLPVGAVLGRVQLIGNYTPPPAGHVVANCRQKFESKSRPKVTKRTPETPEPALIVELPCVVPAPKTRPAQKTRVAAAVKPEERETQARPRSSRRAGATLIEASESTDGDADDDDGPSYKSHRPTPSRARTTTLKEVVGLE